MARIIYRSIVCPIIIKANDLRELLSRPGCEPVAIVNRKLVGGHTYLFIERTPLIRDIADKTLLYTAPPGFEALQAENDSLKAEVAVLSRSYEDAHPTFVPTPSQALEILNKAGLEASKWADSQDKEPTPETASHKMLEIVISMVAGYAKEAR